MSLNRSGHRRVLAIVATLGLLMSAFPSMAAAVGDAGSPSGDGIQPTALAGNRNCAPGDGEFELRIQSPADGPFTHAASGFTITLDVRSTAEGQVFDYIASGGTIFHIYVKAGPDTNLYDYGAAGSDGADTNLHGTVNPSNGRYYGLSHISICFNDTASPSLTTQASAAITIGGTIHDVATLSGATSDAGGTITFALYGPDDATCSGTNLVATDASFTVAVSGNGNYTSPSFTPTAVGTYRWIANYSGDAKNNATANGCNEANESVVVSLNQPSLSTTPNVLPNDSATLSGLVDPSGGTITFKLFFNADCTGDPIDTWSSTVSANGTFSSSNTTHTVSADTVISWIVEYSGDAKNAAATSGCAAEQADVDFTPLQAAP